MSPIPHLSSHCCVSGPFNAWSSSPSDSFRADFNGTAQFSISLELLESCNAQLEFKFIVDGEWRVSDAYPVVPAFGGGNNLVDLREEVEAFKTKKRSAGEAGESTVSVEGDSERENAQRRVLEKNEAADERRDVKNRVEGHEERADAERRLLEKLEKKQKELDMKKEADGEYETADEELKPVANEDRGPNGSDVSSSRSWVAGSTKAVDKPTGIPIAIDPPAFVEPPALPETPMTPLSPASETRGRVAFRADTDESETSTITPMTASGEHPIPNWRAVLRPRSISASSASTTRSIFDLTEEERREIARRHEIWRREKEDREEAMEWAWILLAGFVAIVVGWFYMKR